MVFAQAMIVSFTLLNSPIGLAMALRASTEMVRGLAREAGGVAIKSQPTSKILLESQMSVALISPTNGMLIVPKGWK